MWLISTVFREMLLSRAVGATPPDFNTEEVVQSSAPTVWKWAPWMVPEQVPVLGSHTRSVASFSPPPVTTVLPSGAKRPHRTAPECPLKTYASRVWPAACLATAPQVQGKRRLMTRADCKQSQARRRGTTLEGAGQGKGACRHEGSRLSVPQPGSEVFRAGQDQVPSRVPVQPLYRAVWALQNMPAAPRRRLPDAYLACTVGP